MLTLAIKGIAIPLAARRLLVTRLALKRDAAMSTGLSTSLIAGGALTAFAYLVTRPAAAAARHWWPPPWCRCPPR